jgi:hypothetical protein
MFKLNTSPVVLSQLQQAFPASNAQRLLRKYTSTLESMLLAAIQRGQTPMQRKLGLYSLSLHKLTHQGGQIGPDRVRLHAWLQHNGLALVETIQKGSNLTGRWSEVRLTQFAQLDNQLETANLTEHDDLQLEPYLSGGTACNQQLVQLLYPDLVCNASADIEHDYDIVNVDRDSLANYIDWVRRSADKYSSEKRAQALRQARIVQAVASTFDGMFPQRKKQSHFGRMYYEGVSIQSVNKELRAAILGNSWEYDIRSSVISWKMGFASRIAAAQGKRTEDLFSATLCYLEDRSGFMVTLRSKVFGAEMHRELAEKLIKQAITAISFGARNRTHGWRNQHGQWRNPALAEIIKNESQRRAFLSCSLIRDFIQEQNLLDQCLYDAVKAQWPELLQDPELQTNSGKSSKAKVLAFLYQHAEAEVMQIVHDIAAAHGREVLARVHDAIFLRHRLGPDLKHEVELAMREATSNPYWHMTAKQISRYERRAGVETADERAHRLHIAEEEASARGYAELRRSWGANALFVMDSQASV